MPKLKLQYNLLKLGWYDKVRIIAQYLSNDAIFKSSCIFECAYAFGEDDSERAMVLYEELVRREPENSSAINNLGVQYQKRRELFKALACYEKACSISPQQNLYQKNLQIAEGIILRQREAAISEMAKSISLDVLEKIGYTTNMCKRVLQIEDLDMRSII